ncbi:MAG: hypothetical protein PF440_01280 [Thiomicrorhabdus sp.]|jgi:hypothetical protein|nr:hypothetical protein [Thiomicrorhabdus sp.]
MSDNHNHWATINAQELKIKELEKQLAESMAHCGVLNSALIQALAFMARETCDIEDEQQQKRIQDAVRNYKKALEQTPQQSLLLHYADVVERACAKLVPWNESGITSKDQLLEMVDQIRQQAKEGVK